jgi:hypothetical protein
MSGEPHVPPSLPPLTNEYEGQWAPNPVWTVWTTEQIFIVAGIEMHDNLSVSRPSPNHYTEYVIPKYYS